MLERIHRLRRHFVLLLLLTAALPVHAGSQITTYEGCADAAGRTVASEMDYNVAAVAKSSLENARPVIRYNPQVLPQLKSETRLFLYARECAHHALGHPLEETRTPAMERRADCWAIETLMRSGLLKGESVLTDIRVDLVRSPEEWSSLPGPPRAFNLEACYRSALALPKATPPSADQAAWNACLRVCAERLRYCPRNCRSEACDQACDAGYRDCSGHCNTRFPP